MTTTASQWRTVTVALTSAAMLALTACGDDDSADPASTSGVAEMTVSKTSPAPAEPRPEEDDTARGSNGGDGADPDDNQGAGGKVRPADDADAVTRTVRGMYRDLAVGDAGGVCAAMSRQARRQIAQQVPGGSSQAPADRSCETSMSAFLRAARSTGNLARTADVQVLDVQVDGAKAEATVSFGGSPGKIVLHRQDGAWRFGPSALSPGS